jgi:hypothetical protein
MGRRATAAKIFLPLISALVGGSDSGFLAFGEWKTLFPQLPPRNAKRPKEKELREMLHDAHSH